MKYSVDEKKIRVRPKAEIKKDIHESPGLLDVAMMLTHRHITSEGGLASALIDRQSSRFVITALTRAQKERRDIIRSNKHDV